MAIRPMFLDAFQLGKETTFGTLVAASKKINTITQGLPQSRIPITAIKPTGNFFDCGVSLGKIHSELRLEGSLGYIAALYLMSGHFTVPSFVSNVATFQPANTTSNPVNFFTVEYGPSGSSLASRVVSAHVPDISMRFDLQNPTLQGRMVGKSLSDGITLTASPTEHPCTVVSPTDWKVLIGANVAGLTTIARVTAAEFSSSGRWSPQFYADQTTVPAEMREGSPEISLRFTANEDSVMQAFNTQLFAGTTYCMRIACANADTNYAMNITAAGTFRQPEMSVADELTQRTWEFIPKYDATIGFVYRWSSPRR